MKLVKKIFQVLSFLVFYMKNLIAANLKIAADVLTPGLKIQPGFLKIPLRTRSEMEIFIFSNLVTMTPGTLSLEVAEDGKYLFIHSLYLHDLEAARKTIAEDLQNRVLEVLRWPV